MGIKRYVLLSIVYMLAVGLYVYSFNGDKYTLDLYALSVNLPIAIWIVVSDFYSIFGFQFLILAFL